MSVGITAYGQYLVRNPKNGQHYLITATSAENAAWLVQDSLSEKVELEVSLISVEEVSRISYLETVRFAEELAREQEKGG